MSLRRAMGLSKLVEGAVEHGSRAVQKVHLGTSARTFAILERVPGIATPAGVVRVVHDGWTSAIYATIRGVNKVAFVAIGAAIDVADRVSASDERGSEAGAHEASSAGTTRGSPGPG